MKEREKILIGKEKKTLADRKLQVSLDRADAIIEGASPLVFGFSRVRVLTCLLRLPRDSF
jgi:hypothetical protein